MLPTHHFLALVPNRVQSAVTRLKQSIWFDCQSLAVEASDPSEIHESLEVAVHKPLRPVVVGQPWGKLYDQRWYRVMFPDHDGSLYINWRDQAEGTLYLDSIPYYGLDVAHRYCALPRNVRVGWVEAVCIQSGIWHPESSGLSHEGARFEGAFTCQKNEDAWHAYHDLKCLFDLMLDERARENPQLQPHLIPFGCQQPGVENNSPYYRRMLRLLDEAVDIYDRRGVPALREKLAEIYREFRRKDPMINCTISGHAHIDLVWLWPERVGEFKATHVFATMNRLMDSYPEFRFSYSQPASYEAVRRHSSGLYDRILERIHAGRWEATGAMYVESDTWMACGEALARGFSVGQEAFCELSGKRSTLTWLPDAFGFTACLPQVMKLSGVDYLYTTKMMWNPINRFPYSSFIWKGMDGSEIVTHMSQNSGYVTHMNVGDVKNGYYGHLQSDVHGEYILPTGYGDGGGGTTDEMCERARRLDSMPNMPSLTWDHPEAFFKRMESVRNRLPAYQGECYLEYHRGTYTTHGNLKEAFRRLERELQIREAVACCRSEGPISLLAWKRAIFSQFHDYITGTSIPDVYLEGVPDLNRISLEQHRDSQQSLETEPAELCIFNPLPIPVKEWISPVEGCDPVYVEIPPMSGIAASTAMRPIVPAPVSLAERQLSNDLVELKLEKDGTIGQLRTLGREIKIAEPLAALVTYQDFPTAFDCWEIDRHTLSTGAKCATPVKIKMCDQGAHRAGLSVSRTIGEKSRITVVYWLESGSPTVQIEVHLDWHEPKTLLKMHFPTRYRAPHARFGCGFGSVLRPQLPVGMAAEAMWEVPFSRHLAVFDEGESEGLFLVTESKYGASVHNGDIGLSLVRSPQWTGFDDAHINVRPPHLARVQPESRFTDIGRHDIRFSIGLYDGTSPREHQPAVLADRLYTRPFLYNGKPVSTAYHGLEGGHTLVPCWAIPGSSERWTLRMHEVSGRRGSSRLMLDEGWRATAVNLLGEPIDKLVDERGQFDYSPYEIISLEISRA